MAIIVAGEVRVADVAFQSGNSTAEESQHYARGAARTRWTYKKGEEAGIP